MKNQTFTVGNATFPLSHRKYIEQELIDQSIIEHSLTQPDLMRYYHKTSETYFSLVSLMCEAAFQQLWMGSALNPDAIHCFVKCKFTHLKLLSLYENNIQSIEALTFLDVPHLNTIHLVTNNITHCKSLNKTYWKDLIIEQNNINDLSLSRFVTKTNDFESIYYEPCLNNYPMMQNIAILLKIQAKRLGKLIIHEEQRIKQPFVLKQLTKKYQYIIFSHDG